MKQSKKMRLLSTVLAVMLIFSTMPIAVLGEVNYDESIDNYYNVISKDDYEIAPGITESEIVLNNSDSSRRQVLHVMEADINNEYVKVMPSYKGMGEALDKKEYAVEIMSKQAAWVEENMGYNVVGAMNISLSWYDSTYYQNHPELVGEPLGYMILDGKMYTNSQGKSTGAQTCLVINFDEKEVDGVMTTRPDSIPKTEIRSTSTEITGWEEQVIPANFGFLVKDGKNVTATENHTSDSASRSFVGIKEDGTIVMVMNDGRQSPYSEGMNYYEMGQFMLSLGCVYAVNGDGGGSSAFLSQRPGEELKVNCSPSDGAERETTHGILMISTAPATGEFVRAHIESDEDYYTPGSEVQFTATGADLVGTPAEIPAGATWQLADETMGTIDQNGLFVSNGTEGEVTVQFIYNDNVVGEDTIYIVMPDTISFGQTTMTVPFGKTVDVALSATYNSKNVVLKASDVEFELSDDSLGTVEGFDFTATQEGAGVTAGTLTATVGELSITADINLGKGSEIVYDFEDADISDWYIDDQYGKYGPKGPNGKVTDDNGNYWYNGQNELGDIWVVDSETGKVKNGAYALAMECDFTQIYETGYHGLLFRFPTIDCADSVAVGFWMYVPEEAKHAEVRMGVGGSANTIYDNGELMDLAEGWNYVSVDMTNVSTKNFSYINIQIDDRACSSDAAYYDYRTEANLNGKYVFYVDDITIDYSTAVDDRELPIFSAPVVLSETGESSAELEGQSVDYNTLTFEAYVEEDTTKTNATGLDAATAMAYIDGVETDFSYKNGKFSISGARLADGLHTITFAICDNMGNYAHISGEILVEAGTDLATVEVVPHDAEADRLMIGSLYWLDVVATDVEEIQEVSVELDLNNASKWELDGILLAEGFSAEYTIEEDDNIATVVITRTGDNNEVGETVIASLPARTWVSTITECEGYEDQTPEVLWSRGIIWHKSMIVEQDMGLITFVDGTKSTFDSEDIEVDTEVWFTYYSRKLVEGAVDYYAANTSWHTHTEEELEDKVATCTTAGYTDRTYCEVCDSVVEWGNVEEATGHNYVVTDGVLMCEYCYELYNGEIDGKTYVDGVIADGWVDETYYYIDGVKVTGQYYMDGVLYTFDEDGKYDADYSYTGFYTTEDNKLMYFMGNKYLTGYQYLAGEPYYFDVNGYGYEGEYVLCGETCYFEGGQYVSCLTANLIDAGKAGAKAEYVIYSDGTFVLDGSGETYSFTNHGTRPFIGYTYKIKTLKIGSDITRIGTYFFAYSSVSNIVFEEHSSLKQIGSTAFYQDYALKTVELPDSVEYISNMAFGKCENLSKVVMPENITTISTNAFKNWSNLTLHVAEGSYAMDYAIEKGIPYVVYSVDPDEAEGEIVDVEGVLYYYENGSATYAGLIKLDGDYYYVRSSGKIAVDCVYWVTKTNDLLPAGNYKFDSEGKMIDPPVVEEEEQKGEIVDVDGVLYYYENGTPVYAGLIELGGEYYYVRSSGKIVVDATYWVTKTNGLKDAGNYKFDSDGKMVIEPTVEPDEPEVGENGKIVEENGVLYYYENGLRVYAGLIKLDGDYYYVRSNGQLAVDCVYWVTKTNDWLAVGNYTFGSDGKMVNAPITDEEEQKGEIVEENGVLYYYENGVLTYAGLIELDGDYYYVRSSGKLAVDCVYWVTKTNGLKDAGNYTFDSDGKMIAE